MQNGLQTDDKVTRCWWCGSDPLYRHYHDQEWGFPTNDDQRLFEKICLEGFQSGLSWSIILNKRENFRRAFKKFNIEPVARFNNRSVNRLLRDKGIVRHRGKIESVMNNARCALELIEAYGSLAAYFWQFEPGLSARPKRMTYKQLMSLAKTNESITMSKDLKRRGWTFVGPTTLYAFMQSVGMVNDHLHGCSTRTKAEKAKQAFRRPC